MLRVTSYGLKDQNRFELRVTSCGLTNIPNFQYSIIPGSFVGKPYNFDFPKLKKLFS
jgi:hypothetical protein